MAASDKELWLRVNGVQPAFGYEYSLDSPRANEGRTDDPYRQANCSYSLLQLQDGNVIRHTLIDVGMGVVPSLLELERDHQVSIVDEVLLSHSHFDHIAGLDWLCGALRRGNRADQPRPLPIYCSRKCWKYGPQRIFDYLIGRAIEHHRIRSSVAITFGDLTITPFSVEHDETAPGAEGFVITYGNRKILLPCDFLTIDDEENPLLQGADVCFLHTTNWHEATFTGHHCISDAIRLIDLWQPQRTYITHYSGYHDTKHPTTTVNTPLDSLGMEKALKEIRGPRDIQPAKHGMMIHLKNRDRSS